MALREAFHVQLVDERLVPGRARRPVVSPCERGVDDRRERRVRRAVARVECGVVFCGSKAEQGLVPVPGPSHDLRVRITGDLGWIDTMVAVRPVRAVPSITG